MNPGIYISPRRRHQLRVAGRKYHTTHKAEEKLYRAQHTEENKLRVKKWCATHKRKIKKYIKSWQTRNPHKIKAHINFYLAKKRGAIHQQICEVCKYLYRKNVKGQGHHTDYTKHLKVMWLCSKHHRAWHRIFKTEDAK